MTRSGPAGTVRSRHRAGAEQNVPSSRWACDPTLARGKLRRGAGWTMKDTDTRTREAIKNSADDAARGHSSFMLSSARRPLPLHSSGRRSDPGPAREARAVQLFGPLCVQFVLVRCCSAARKRQRSWLWGCFNRCASLICSACTGTSPFVSAARQVAPSIARPGAGYSSSKVLLAPLPHPSCWEPLFSLTAPSLRK